MTIGLVTPQQRDLDALDLVISRRTFAPQIIMV
ncbi:hypothetical protein BKA03_002851 [Demequina lutea]|uniref:Uncharacterized protein n=1 Tax=Demequina lutea TaxID=431489 RepID=A0A7Y9ZCB5_9MICO|nr:hypothetical protein [Demequina lutea]